MPDTTTTTAAAATAPTPVVLPDFGGGAAGGAPGAIGLLSDVQLQVRIELGRTKMLVEDVLKLNADSVVELDKAAGDPVDIYVNGRRIARGEVLVLNENFCVRVSEIIEPIDG
jgi:flagellar motor switch protein FliN/FliY